MVLAETNLTRKHKAAGFTPGPAQRVKDPGLPQAVVQVRDKAQIRHWCGLRHRPAVVALIRSLPREPPYAVRAA